MIPNEAELNKLLILRVLVSEWGADVRCPYFYEGYHVLALHVTAAHGDLSLTKYLIEECGLSVDELTPDLQYTPLSFARDIGRFVGLEERRQAEITYLLKMGADVTFPGADVRTRKPQAHIIEENSEVSVLLQRARDREVFAAKQRDAEAAAQALLAELEAEEAEAESRQQKAKKDKGGKGGKKKKKEEGERNGQGPLLQGETKEEDGNEKGQDNAVKEGGALEEEKERGGSKKEEEQTQSSGHGQHEIQPNSTEDDAMMA